MSKPKLSYFSSRGLLEPLRILLADAQVDYIKNDLGVFLGKDAPAPEAFVALKESGALDFGSVPLWEEEGLALNQSSSIVRHVARKYGYNGANEIEAAKIDSALEGCKDFSQALRRHATVPSDQKLKVWNEIVTIDIPKWLGYFEALLKKSGTGYLVGSKLSYADIYLAYYMEELKGVNAAALAAFPLLSAHQEMVYARPSIAAYATAPTRFPSMFSKLIPTN